ncbi:Protein phosphatase 1 regulatory inhibitor subunit PPP1R7 [Glycine soja]|uniref:protein phosphatase 1 regulatory subunit 7-like isoform X1 n=1 Tax=Glycine max TaxID=3847 RepID=UPI001B357883|nr:protein phosphatase 1 regulatory subunit 7-like isoform X1 [Glycine max]KAH1235904.1 Protein phosphatase 1 regulatory inhibitor subunit PPP1R7 [Glycine max]
MEAVESIAVPEPDEDDPSSTLLDLSSYQLHDLDSVELPPSLTELDLTANRLSTLDPRIGNLSHLKKLSLRQNLITDAAVLPLSSWNAISSLEELVLRDNQLKNIPDVTVFKKLLVFDVAFNEISSLHGLSRVSDTLKELYVSNNEVAKIEEIEHFHQLQILELGSNKLRVMENLQSLENLQELWLGQNRIKVVNLCGLKCIKKISFQSNRLTSMTGFEGCVALEELYLSHNGIAKMEGLSSLVNLRVLDVSSNKITSVDDIVNLTKYAYFSVSGSTDNLLYVLTLVDSLPRLIYCRLEDLWLNDNQIASLEGIAEAVSGSKEKLTTIYLKNNPCAKTPNYTGILREIFPNIQQIDSDIFS